MTTPTISFHRSSVRSIVPSFHRSIYPHGSIYLIDDGRLEQTLDCWNAGTMECWNGRWNAGMMERANAIVVSVVVVVVGKLCVLV
jgi:hypothetical protein